MKDSKRKLNKNFYILIFIIVLVIVGMILIVKDMNYKKTHYYKLLIRGYNEGQIKLIKKLNNDEIDNILKLEFIEKLDKFITDDYFIFKNLNTYISYYKDNVDEDISKVIALVNTKAYKPYYTDVISSDTTKKELMLVNKYSKLDEDFIPKDIYTISDWYSYGKNSAVESVYDMFIDMHLEAKKKDLFIIVNSSYRSYAFQKEIYDYERIKNGTEYADSFVAHPGHSEHQSGYTLDLSDGVAIEGDFENTDEFKWLTANAYKYGFILRYPKGKEDLTGFSYEPWHYRYIGMEHAKKIYELGITYDEYYAYYLDK